MMRKRFEQLERSIQKQERERAARDAALLEALADWRRRQRSFWARWGRIWWWPTGARLYARLFRWVFSRWVAPPQRVYRPLAWLYNHWWER